MISKLRAIYRGTTSVLLFGVFGLGALLITPAMLVLRKPELCQPIVRTAWRFILSIFVGARLIRIDRGNLGEIRGSVIAASHPSLIDVLILTSIIPRTMYVAKAGLQWNPFLTAIVRATALPDDSTLPERAAPFLKKGWNVVIFPEGTRAGSSRCGAERPSSRFAPARPSPASASRPRVASSASASRRGISATASSPIRFHLRQFPSSRSTVPASTPPPCA